METTGGTSRSHAVAWGLIAATMVLIFALFYQGMDVYFLASEDPTREQSTRYVWTASLCVACAAGAVVAATIAGRRAAGVTCVVMLLLALLAAAMFAVPQDRFRPEPQEYPLPDNYEPCFSGSNECN